MGERQQQRGQGDPTARRMAKFWKAESEEDARRGG